jgi:heme exporter protein B
MAYFKIVFRREWLFAYRNRAQIFSPWVFFLLVVTLFPLALNSDPRLLKIITPGIIWVGILLAIVLSLEKIFYKEVKDHMIEQWMLYPIAFPQFIFYKLISYSVILMMPVIILLPVIAVLFQLSLKVSLVLLGTMLLGIPTLILSGAIFSALTAFLKHSSVLLSILTLPFYVPILIFATSAMAFAIEGLPISGPLFFLAAFLFIMMPLAPFAAAYALRAGVG